MYGDPSRTVLALVPMWDMMNYKKGELTTDFDDNSVKSHAMENFSQGEQIFSYYGHRSSADYFLHNG